MKIISQIFAIFLFLSVSACFDPPKRHPQLDQIRTPEQQAVDVPARTYEFKGHSFGENVSSTPLAANVLEADKVKVALMLPLSGKAEKVGKMLADAAQLGLFIEGSSNLSVKSYDTKSTTEGAIDAAYQAISDNPDVIIGPLFSNEVQAVAPIASGQRIPILAFSNDKKAAGNGVYLLGLMPDDRIRRMLAFAQSKGVSNYAALLPDNVLGNEVMFGLRNSARGNSFNLQYAQIYPAASSEFASYTNEIAAKIAASGVANIDSNAIILTETGEKLEQILANLHESGVQRGSVRFIGINAWDNGKVLRNQSLQAAWITNVNAAELGLFNDNFYSNFGYKALPIAALSYDAILLAAELGKGNIGDASLSRSQGFYGANGAYRFRPDGTAERQYDIMEISGGGAFVIDEAEKLFNQ